MTGSLESRGVPPKRSDLVSALLVGVHLVLVFLPLAMAPFFATDWKLILFSVWFGVGMNGLLNLLHECAHLHVFKSPALSAALGRWVLGPLVIADFDGYQKRHWQHHRDLGKETDPKYVYRIPVHGHRILTFSLRCLFLVEAVKKFTVQAPTAGQAVSGNPLWMLRALVVQILLFGGLFGSAFLLGGEALPALKKALWVYAVVYLYGIAAVTVWVSSLRAIAEHQPTSDGAMTEGNAALRNFSFGLFTGFLLGAYGFKDHASHHSEPGIPYYRLKDRTGQLAATNPAFAPRSSYEKVLLSLIRRKGPAPEAGSGLP